MPGLFLTFSILIFILFAGWCCLFFVFIEAWVDGIVDTVSATPAYAVCFVDKFIS